MAGCEITQKCKLFCVLGDKWSSLLCRSVRTQGQVNEDPGGHVNPTHPRDYAMVRASEVELNIPKDHVWTGGHVQQTQEHVCCGLTTVF